MSNKKLIIIFQYLIITPLICFAFLNSSNIESKKYDVYRGRVYFFIAGENKKSCIDCHNVSGLRKNDYPIIIGEKVGFENIMNHINNVAGILDDAEKDSLLFYIKELSTKTVEGNSNAKLSSKKMETVDKKTRERLLALGYIDSSENAYKEPLITLEKKVEFSSIELSKFCSLGFERIRDSLSDIGLSLKSQGQFVKAIVLPVVDLQLDSFFLTLVYRNAVADSKAEIKIYDYFNGENIDQKNIDLQKTEKILKQSFVFQKKYQKIFIFIRFYTDENLNLFGLSLDKLE